MDLSTRLHELADRHAAHADDLPVDRLVTRVHRRRAAARAGHAAAGAGAVGAIALGAAVVAGMLPRWADGMPAAHGPTTTASSEAEQAEEEALAAIEDALEAARQQQEQTLRTLADTGRRAELATLVQAAAASGGALSGCGTLVPFDEQDGDGIGPLTMGGGLVLVSDTTVVYQGAGTGSGSGVVGTPDTGATPTGDLMLGLSWYLASTLPTEVSWDGEVTVLLATPLGTDPEHIDGVPAGVVVGGGTFRFDDSPSLAALVGGASAGGFAYGTARACDPGTLLPGDDPLPSGVYRVYAGTPVEVVQGGEVVQTFVWGSFGSAFVG